MDPRIVSFNVGGQLFETTQATLESCGPCALSAWATTEVGIVRDREGRIFVDRNPRVFGHVLDYLRDPRQKQLLLSEESPLLRRAVEDELRFFCIGPPPNSLLSDVAIRQALTGRHKQNVDSWLETYRLEVAEIRAAILRSFQELASSRRLLRTRCASVWYAAEALADDPAFPSTYGAKLVDPPLQMKNTCSEWFSDFRKTFSAVTEDAVLVTLSIPPDDLMKLLVSIAKNLQEQQSLSCEVVSLFQITHEKDKEKESEPSEMTTAFRFFQRRVFGFRWSGVYDNNN